jgi:hypothetical protein
MFRFLRILHIILQSGCTSLHSHQQCMGIPFFPHPHQHLLVLFLMMVILTRVKWNLSVVLICISFMARDGDHFFMCFWPFEFLILFCLVQLLIPLLVHWFWEFGFLSSLYILVISYRKPSLMLIPFSHSHIALYFLCHNTDYQIMYVHIPKR